MKKKELVVVGVVLVLVCLAGAFGFTALSNSLKGTSPKKEASIVGSWKEDSTGVDVNFTDDGVFEIMKGDAANYKLDEDQGTITLKYAEAYGGQEIVMNYELTETQLTLTNSATGEVQTYTRQGEGQTGNPTPANQKPAEQKPADQVPAEQTLTEPAPQEAADQVPAANQ